MGMRGPQKEPTKIKTTIRLSSDVLEAFRATGPGWQTRINDALRDWLRMNQLRPVGYCTSMTTVKGTVIARSRITSEHQATVTAKDWKGWGVHGAVTYVEPLFNWLPEGGAKPADANLRQLWIQAGGRFHGPHVETATMPEEKLYPFLRSLIRGQNNCG